MLSKSQIKLITSLDKKKYRNKYQLFVVEGVKSITEFLQSSYQLEQLYTIDDTVFTVNANYCTLITPNELKKISFLTTPNTALAVFKMKTSNPINLDGLVVALDNIGDPGNLGTIIRLCDWFGVSHLICNTETVDCYSPKVVQASMGSFTRVQISYCNLEVFLNKHPNHPVYGTFMNGESIYDTPLPDKGIVILGNEAHGISAGVSKLVSKRITIPQFGNNQKTESLNVATATAIVLSEFRRQIR